MTSTNSDLSAREVLFARTLEGIDIESALTNVHRALSTLERLAYGNYADDRYTVARDLLSKAQRELIRGLTAPVSESDKQKLKEVIDNAPF